MAAGAWTRVLNCKLGCRIPSAGKGYSRQCPAQVMPKIPLMFEEHRVAVTPMHPAIAWLDHGVRGYDTTCVQSRLDLLRRRRPLLAGTDAEPIWKPGMAGADDLYSIPIIWPQSGHAKCLLSAHNILVCRCAATEARRRSCNGKRLTSIQPLLRARILRERKRPAEIHLRLSVRARDVPSATINLQRHHRLFFALSFSVRRGYASFRPAVACCSLSRSSLR